MAIAPAPHVLMLVEKRTKRSAYLLLRKQCARGPEQWSLDHPKAGASSRRVVNRGPEVDAAVQKPARRSHWMASTSCKLAHPRAEKANGWAYQNCAHRLGRKRTRRLSAYRSRESVELELCEDRFGRGLAPLVDSPAEIHRRIGRRRY